VRFCGLDNLTKPNILKALINLRYKKGELRIEELTLEELSEINGNGKTPNTL
jgi:hypothetical protein